MRKQTWCEHEEKISKYTFVNYQGSDNPVVQKLQVWWCPECGLHGAESCTVDTNELLKRKA